MSFEIINEPVSQSDVTESKEAADVTTTDTDSTVDSSGSDVQADTGSTNVQDTGGADIGEDAGQGETSGGSDDKPEPDGFSDEDVRFFFGEQEVEIEIPDDVSFALKEKGIDAMQVAKELYGEGGKFELTEETKQKLYDAFGKFAVDAYLNGLKASNEAFLIKSEAQAKEAKAADAQRFTDIASEVGGEEGWSRLEEWALETLSDEELAAFNAVMASGNQYLQQYAVRELEGRRKQAQGDDKPSLIEPSAPAKANEENGPLTRDQYVQAIATLSQKYGNDRKAMAEAQAKLDARRRAGMARGL
ncbi:capsid assembly scaffolding protein [Escherichia phage vB_EcoP-G3A1]|uniref:Capsid assembly scaffolding protein n=1 Tax=Escherichia phage vB_EcoP-101117UKE2 TaxID=2865796 RepID=A0AAE7XRT8_9CAUD|nr:capsid assembly scaffolding protein [Escherichia phage vB_EcoP-101117UKE2]QZI79654.1 capsid assembly scaffolding protein [Escherichia phage vB_EcoP-101118B1]QZI81258.1 capsid assembly scaffolding protein [Escherichia phage vB_EcoP-G3A1]